MTEIFILWITVSSPGVEPYSFKMDRPFATERVCNYSGNYIVKYMYKDLQARFPRRTYIFTLECEPYMKARV